MFLGRNLVIWRNKRQTLCARSSAEIKYRTVAFSVIELLWLKILLKDIKIHVKEVMKLYCENKAVINLSNKSSVT